MNKVAFVLSLAFLIAAIAGRYQAELAVRDSETRIALIDARIEEAELEEQQLKMGLARLENPAILAEIAEGGTRLRPVEPDQLYSAPQFVAAFDPLADKSGDPSLYYPDQVIMQALAEPARQSTERTR